jgi:hypothetical protein
MFRRSNSEYLNERRAGWGFGALVEIERYHEFLLIIAGRHLNAGRDFVEASKALSAYRRTLDPSDHAVTPEQQHLLDVQWETMRRLDLDSESFYTFAKIILDRVAQFIEFYFGQARGTSLASHHKLVEKIDSYTLLKSISVPDRLTALARTLYEDIVKFRDKEITHRNGPQMVRGKRWSEDGRIRSFHHPWPQASHYELVATRHLDELLHDIESYVEAVVDLLEANRNKATVQRHRTATSA